MIWDQKQIEYKPTDEINVRKLIDFIETAIAKCGEHNLFELNGKETEQSKIWWDTKLPKRID